MKRAIKANLFWAILGLVVTFGGFGLTAVYNWSDCADVPFEFAKSDDKEDSGYYTLNGKSELTSIQTEGNSNCKYKLSKRTRTDSTYKTIYSNECYEDNNTAYNLYDVSFGAFADTKFRMNKTAGTSVKSKVIVYVEK